MRKFFLLLMVFTLFSFSDTSLKKRISDAQYRYEFYTTNKVVSAQQGRSYYWFKGGAIHNSEYGMAGELLHDSFLKFYHTNQLAEAGTYKNGLKEGYWKNWFDNGTLQSQTYWNKGQKDGKHMAYDKTGFLTEAGSYKNNSKHGRWINYLTKDTLKYRDGKVVPKKVKAVKAKDSVTAKQGRPNLFKRIFAKKDKQGAQGTAGVNKKVKVSKNKTQKQVEQNSAGEQQKKPGFFKRIFTKKQKTQTTANG